MCAFVIIGKYIVYKCCSGFGNWRVGLTVIGKNIADIIWFTTDLSIYNFHILEAGSLLK